MRLFSVSPTQARSCCVDFDPDNEFSFSLGRMVGVGSDEQAQLWQVFYV